MKYHVSERASEDIESIWLYTYENWSLEQADRYYNLIMDEIEYVAKNFESGRSMEHLRKGYRCARLKSHLVFYKKTPKNIVEIIRVLHHKMDIENHLED